MSRSTRMTSPQRGRSTPPSLSWWSSTRDQWLAAGLDASAMDPVFDAVQRVSTLHGEKAAAMANVEAVRREARNDVATGKRSFGDVAKKLAEAQAVEQLSGEVPRMIKTLEAELAAVMAKVGDRLVVEHLAPAFAEGVVEAEKLAPLIARIETDRDAVRASDDEREAWARLTFLAARSAALYRLAARLRNEHVVAVVEAFELEYENRAPDLLPNGPQPTPVHSFVADVTSGAQPAILTAAEVEDLEAAREVPLRVPAKRRPIVARSGALVGGSAW